MDKTPDIEIEGHDYDGIKEYDNPLPMWWLWTFFITIIFSFIYYIHYEVAGGPTLKDELNVAMSQIEQLKAKNAPQVTENEETLMAKMNDPKLIELGAATYTGKCAACHGDKLQGQIGPNLVDNYWIHTKGTMVGLVKTIREGVAEKGMPPWANVLKQDEVYGVSAFIHSKHGSNPAGAKEPQGELIQ